MSANKTGGRDERRRLPSDFGKKFRRTTKKFLRETAVSIISNMPESEAITSDDHEVFEAAREGIRVTLKREFETWMTIGKAVARARDIADRRGGGKTFMRIIEQQDLGDVVSKATASNLLRIMERIDEVRAWHAALTTKQQIEIAAPSTILKRCPIQSTDQEGRQADDQSRGRSRGAGRRVGGKRASEKAARQRFVV